MLELTDFQLGIITECTVLANYGRIVYNGDSYYLDSPRLGRKVDIPEEDINNLIDNGVLHKHKHGGVKFDNVKAEEIYPRLFVIEKIPHPKHERMHLDVCRFPFAIS